MTTNFLIGHLQRQGRIIAKLKILLDLLEKIPPSIKRKPFSGWNCQYFYDKYSDFTIHYKGNQFNGQMEQRIQPYGKNQFIVYHYSLK